MKGFLEEYGLIIVVVAVILLMLLFGKTGYAKSIQDAILGSADHIVETGENITKKEVHITAGDMLDIEGVKYVVLEERENNQALVMTTSRIENKKFQSTYVYETKLRPDGQNANTYEGSTIDNYLENEWYNSLSSTMKAAIQTTNIKQASYYSRYSLGSKEETGHNGQVYNTISRHAFLPSVSEIGKAVDLENPNKVKSFLNGSYSMWTRDSYHGNASDVMYFSGSTGKFYNDDSVVFNFSMRPAFVIDLSKVDYTEAGHTDYK